MNTKYQHIEQIVQSKLTYAAHDYDHVMRVVALCKVLAQAERSVDMDVLIPAALLHDIAREIEDKDITGEIDHAVLGAELAQKILQDLSYTDEEIGKITHCIASHRFRSGHEPETAEAKILFDADKLDVIGAVGIARSFMLAGEHGERLHRDIALEEYIRDNVGENGRIKDLTKHTAYFEFELKLKKIPERLYTTKAKEIAKTRIEDMDHFFKRLIREISSNDL